MRMRWTGSDEEVTGAIAMMLIVAALVVVGTYAWQLAHHAG